MKALVTRHIVHTQQIFLSLTLFLHRTKTHDRWWSQKKKKQFCNWKNWEEKQREEEEEKYTRLNEKSKPSNCGTGVQLSLSASWDNFSKVHSRAQRNTRISLIIGRGVLNLDLIVLSWKKISYLEVKKFKCDKTKKINSLWRHLA